jgi:class 3 adenylate cyclase
LIGDEDYIRWMARYERQSLTPQTFVDLYGLMADIDVRALLPTIRVPTLILHRDDELLDVRNAHYLAERIPGARLVVLPGRDHLPWVDQERFMDEVEEFVTGTPHTVSNERMLATILFTDIADSTGLATRLGDVAWRRLLDEHDALAASAVRDYGGRVVKSTGDGVLAAFDVPSRAVQSALRLRRELHTAGITIRAGVHTGEVEKRGDDLGGIGVHIAARIERAADDGEILASSTVRDLSVGSALIFESLGISRLRGVDGEWLLYRVAGDS